MRFDESSSFSNGRNLRGLQAKQLCIAISHALLHFERSRVSLRAFPATAELEKQLAKAEKERDDLARDVEALCMQSGSSIFDGSMVLSERIFSAEKELSRVKAQVGYKLLLHSGIQSNTTKFCCQHMTVIKTLQISGQEGAVLSMPCEAAKFYISLRHSNLGFSRQAGHQAEVCCTVGRGH